MGSGALADVMGTGVSWVSDQEGMATVAPLLSWLVLEGILPSLAVRWG